MIINLWLNKILICHTRSTHKFLKKTHTFTIGCHWCGIYCLCGIQNVCALLLSRHDFAHHTNLHTELSPFYIVDVEMNWIPWTSPKKPNKFIKFFWFDMSESFVLKWNDMRIWVDELNVYVFVVCFACVFVWKMRFENRSSTT